MHNSKEIYNKLNKVKEQLNNIKKQEEEAKKQQKLISEKCTHEYILIYDKGNEYLGEKVFKGNCLICNKKFSLDSNDLKKIKTIKEFCIIDITKEFRKYDMFDIFELDRYANKEKIYKAQIIFNKYFTGEYDNYSDEDLRYMIKKDILENFGIKKQKTKTKKIYGEW